ncbi:MAG: hypothetical protein EWM72_01024 [Nitrospira sp.]|nr:MAG: hypothetical protein EWM72_01024 [Nitrospira sp.]
MSPVLALISQDSAGIANRLEALVENNSYIRDL